MTTEIPQIRNLRTLNEAKKVLRVQAQYHKMGVELELRKKLSGASLLSGVLGTTSSGQDSSDNNSNAISYAPIIGALVSAAVSVVSVKMKTGSSWGDVLKQVFTTLIGKYAGKILGTVSKAATNS